jgi:hypothetical protein
MDTSNPEVRFINDMRDRAASPVEFSRLLLDRYERLPAERRHQFVVALIMDVAAQDAVRDARLRQIYHQKP